MSTAAAVNDLDWSVTWETDLDDAAHEELAELLVRAYPRAAYRFADGRSWAGAHPEMRVVARRDARPVAHAGIVRRFLRVPATDATVLVGDVGLVAVDPDQHGRGVGRALMEHVGSALAHRGLPYGFLTCGPAVVDFYRAAGWTLLEGATTRSITIDHGTSADDGPTMVCPVAGPLSGWPDAAVLARDGQEL